MIIDYRDLYERMKDHPATKLDRQFNLFSKLWEWRQNDRRMTS